MVATQFLAVWCLSFFCSMCAKQIWDWQRVMDGMGE